MHDLKLRYLEFDIELATQIKKRFDFNKEVLSFARIIDPKVVFSDNYPSPVPIINRFPNLCSDTELEDANTEWKLLKQSKYLFSKDRTGEPIFSKIKQIFTALMCLPHSSACAERIFSQFSLIKTKNRNRLKVNGCNALLHTKKLLRGSTCYTFNPDEQLLSKSTKPSITSANTIDDEEDFSF